MSAGEEKDIDVTFPENYHSKDLAGKPVVFHVKCNKVTTTNVPALDDDYEIRINGEIITLMKERYTLTGG